MTGLTGGDRCTGQRECSALKVVPAAMAKSDAVLAERANLATV
jgi:hypothetical protein